MDADEDGVSSSGARGALLRGPVSVWCCVQHLVGAGTCVYCACCLRRADFQPQLHYVKSNSTLIYNTTCCIDWLWGRKWPSSHGHGPCCSFLSNTHTVRAHPACPCKVHFLCRTKWALSLKGLNRCVHTDLRPVGSLFSLYRGALICRVRVSERRALQGPPLCFYLSTSSPNQNPLRLAQVAHRLLYWCMYLEEQRCPLSA